MENVRVYIRQLVEEGVCVAFSGGVDSSVILKIACEEAQAIQMPVYAVTFETKLHPKADLEIARNIATEVSAIHHVIHVNELDNGEILKNPVDRCYHCKKYLFETLIQYSDSVGTKHILDGTNYDDLHQYRPGIQALKELGIKSPFAELEVTKQRVRAMAEQLDLSVSNRPSTPCLATRLPYGTEIDFAVLEQIEQGEQYLTECGFLVNRIRVHQNIARIEIKTEQMIEMLQIYDKVVEELKKIGFIYITLDLEGFRSGSMDIHLNK